MNTIGTFPFGQPIKKVCQIDQSPKKIFVLGVYASAVHATWIDNNEKVLIRALAVDSEPEIFWRGANVKEIIEQIQMPEGAGKLIPAAKNLNGPSGKALDDCFLKPLGFEDRSEIWLCDLVPHSCQNKQQEAALEREYRTRMISLSLPEYDYSEVPLKLSNEVRQQEILDELHIASPSVIITLGDEPLKWFTYKLDSSTKSQLKDYGISEDTYGQLHDISIDGKRMKHLPLVHPRQAGRLGSHSNMWASCHERWMQYVAPSLLAEL
uniref:Uracil-DNA glycosylase-like domain-containing protein n=1 Tax=Chlorobium chlorochromatii (strain CaD3) TaxID=340177 RepID=Q3ARI2_CHLCH